MASRIYCFIAVVLFCWLGANAQSAAIDNLKYLQKYYAQGFTKVPASSARYRVNTRDELVSALKKAGNGDVVYVNDKAVIDLSGLTYLNLNAGVTLASGRRTRGSRGALLYTDSLNTFPLFYVAGDNVRITGLRIQGPDSARNVAAMKKLISSKQYYTVAPANGIQCKFDRLTVDNCELYGWSHSAIFLRTGASNASIHNNYIHQNQRQGLGYGICLDQANANIYNNVFELNNHSVAGTGKPGTSYAAYRNIVLKSYADSPIFDMHGGKDRGDNTDIAGDSVVLYDNIIYSKSIIFGVRGTPKYYYSIYNNTFVNGTNNAQSLETLKTRSFMKVTDNKNVRF
ncbi:hypothetical protein SAMN04488128_1021557 [Chitinophaga eiseniae]|uniref:Right handed beta helix domain-containing protein n=1 Tax=Chitinophaga eiseniae TaxID=634771 RepID=A0A1T4RWV6_9BACT|nr:right-handed parallel beta-helix repeat-containing protein [Chitinophaga eiseniae]SKA20377.1 hypothetical protein SAMN04488128_1021557 [Chitinophaga eiseniae]